MQQKEAVLSATTVCLMTIFHFVFAPHPTCWLTAQMSVRMVNSRNLLCGGFVVFVVKQLGITDEPIQAFVLCCIMWLYFVVILCGCGLDASRL